MTAFPPLMPTQEELAAMTPAERRERRIAIARNVYGENVRLDANGNPLTGKDGRVLADSMPLNRNHLTALRADLERRKAPDLEEIMAEHTALVEENERAAATKHAGV